MEFVQVHLLTNLDPSLALEDRSRAAARHPPSTGSECFLSRGNTVFSPFFLWIFWGKQKKSGFWGSLAFFIGVLGEYRL